MKLALVFLFVAAAGAPAQTPASLAQQDSVIFARTIARAQQERLDTLPVGEVIVQVGKWFVGTSYTPGTLEQPGPESLVVNLRTFDCVTYVENMLAFGRVIRTSRTDFAAFKRELDHVDASRRVQAAR